MNRVFIRNPGASIGREGSYIDECHDPEGIRDTRLSLLLRRQVVLGHVVLQDGAVPQCVSQVVHDLCHILRHVSHSAACL